MMNVTMYSFSVGVLCWIQLKLMRKTARPRDYVLAGVIIMASILVGLCLAMGIQLMSPSMLLEKWLKPFMR